MENGVSIDSSGIMPDGHEFSGAVELKDYLLAKEQAPFIRNVVERMLAYGLGRDLKHYDEAAILKIIAALEKDNYSARTLISEVALSYPFQFQHPNPEDE